MTEGVRPGRPRIGVTSSSGTGRTTAIEQVGRGYLDGVAAAGGLPLVLPTGDAVLAADAVASVDGLVLTGGADVDPARYGAELHPETGGIDTARDAWELALLAAAENAGVPVLAICRGIQVLAVAHGGTLHQHLPDRTDLAHDLEDRSFDEVQPLDVVPGSRLHGIVGVDVLPANTLHHQAVDDPGTGLVVSARAADGTVEAIEAPDAPVLGVQWHPELLLDRPAHAALFAWVVGEARLSRPPAPSSSSR